MSTCFIQRAGLLAMTILLLSPTICAAESFRIDPARSTITFKVRQFLGTVQGRFQQFSGEIELDRAQPERSTVSATIQVRSIKTGIAKRDEHLLSPEFFNVAKFPEISFKSRRVKQTGKETGDIIGDFTMHGVTRSIAPARALPRIRPEQGGRSDNALAGDNGADQTRRLRFALERRDGRRRDDCPECGGGNGDRGRAFSLSRGGLVQPDLPLFESSSHWVNMTLLPPTQTTLWKQPSQRRKKDPSAEADFLPLQGTDYVEFYVGNAKQAAHFYKTAFGFQSLAYSGPETGNKERRSYVIRQNKLTFVLTTPLRPDNPIADHIYKHGDGVKVLALKVEDATSAWNETTKRGGKSYMEPTTLTGRRRRSGHERHPHLRRYGPSLHRAREITTASSCRASANGNRPINPPDTGLLYVDHCVGNVGWNQMNPWVKFYEDVMGFRNILTFDDKDISTEYSALMSKVMSNGNGFVKFPINEPAEGKKKSQVEEYLDFYNGEGVQHVRDRDERHRQDGDRSAEARRRVPEHPDDLLRHAAGSGGSHR